jgi:hypothetical protein
MTFDEWVETLPANHWAKYDISACKVGWDARQAAIDEHVEKYERFRDVVAFVVNHMPMSDEAYNTLVKAIESVDEK